MADPDEFRKAGGVGAMRAMDMLDMLDDDAAAAITKFCETAYEAMDVLKPESRHEALGFLVGVLIGVWHQYESQA